MKKLLIAATAALAIAGLTACNASQETATKIVIQAATMKLIEQKPVGAERAEKAAEVKRIADAIIEAAGSSEASVAALQSLAMGLLPADLPPSERITAMALIELAGAELNGRVGAGELDPSKLVKVRAVVGWVSQAAGFYGSS